MFKARRGRNFILPTFVLLLVFCPFVCAFVNGSWAVNGSYYDISSFALEVFTNVFANIAGGNPPFTR
jgi:hypothetical protein